MKYVPVLLFAFVPLAFANPVTVTILNEFGFDGEGLGWLELHAEPASDYWNLNGWQIQTNTSVCTLACELAQDSFLIVDSASLAAGTYGHGSFRLDPACDRIRLVPDSSQSWFVDSVFFPVPGCWSGAPLPPAMGSAARLNRAGAEQLITWYVDSTPTTAAENDDYSSVAGTVSWLPSRDFSTVEVIVRGLMGGAYSGVAVSGEPYLVEGLSAGRYAVTAIGQPGNVSVSYPDSIDVGYSAILSGINLDFDPEAVAEKMSGERRTMNVGPTVLAGSSVKSLRSRVIYDAMGQRVVNPNPGVYFVRDEGRGTGGAGRTRKVVVTE